jgi:hypothetical protein
MNSARRYVIALTGLLLLSAHATSAQDMSRYRGYALASSLESIAATSGVRGDDARTIHARPSKIQELEWRAPYAGSSTTLVDPVRGISFSFLDDSLFQIVVTYDRDRTEGLTNRDLIETLTTSYGPPVRNAGNASVVRPAAAHADNVVVAQWETPVEMLTLVRGSYSPEFQLILVSKALGARAQTATREALRLDAAEAPRREANQRKQDAAEATAAREKTRTTNKASFRP